MQSDGELVNVGCEEHPGRDELGTGALPGSPYTRLLCEEHPGRDELGTRIRNR